MNKAVFLYKDGTLIEDVPFNVDPARIKLMPQAVEGLRLLQASGHRLVVLSNQPGAAKGLFRLSSLKAMEEGLRRLLAAGGVTLDGFYVCPHAGDEPFACLCRKPAPGLIQRAARDLGIDPARSWMVGDLLDDVEAGRRAGCRSVLVDNGHETAWPSSPMRRPDQRARDLLDAARLISFDDVPAALLSRIVG